MRIRHTGTSTGPGDESPCGRSPVEWWFLQGAYTGATAGERRFMASLIVQRAPAPQPAPAAGSMLLIGVLDPASRSHACLSQVDRPAIDALAGLAGRVHRTNLDRGVVDACIREVASSGPPRPIWLADTSPIIGSAPLSIAWGSFSLRQSGGLTELGFAEPDSGRACRFRLRPALPRTHLAAIEIGGGATMDYATWPSLDLTGTVDGSRVRGSAWLDHQWGNHGFFVTRSGSRRMLGWDWFGVSLDDGRRLVVMLHRDAQRGVVIRRWALLMEAGRAPRVTRALTAEPVRVWESEVTKVRYPISWRIRIPRFGAALTIEPVADEQEIPVLGVTRAIWEGAATVSGTIRRQPVSGTARLELQGYGCVFDLRTLERDLTERIDGRIAEFFPRVIDEARVRSYVGDSPWTHEVPAFTAVLSKPVWDLLGRGGRHWRPIFGLLMLEALGVRSRPFELLVSVLSELTHTGALIIDDIEDRAGARRGAESIHLRYGLDVAINAANTLYFLPYLLLRRYPGLSERQRTALYRILSEQFVRSHLGQSADIYWSRNLTAPRLRRWMNDSLRPKILQAYADKTGAIVAGLAESACVIAGAGSRERRACTAFARKFGVAFQIIDDILDFDGRAKLRGRVSEDLAGAKPTYVIVSALERLSARDRRALLEVLCQPGRASTGVSLAAGADLVRASGALEACRQEARAMVDEAWDRMALSLPPSEPRILLRALCTSLLEAGSETTARDLPR